jgi:hypothetical protein
MKSLKRIMLGFTLCLLLLAASASAQGLSQRQRSTPAPAGMRVVIITPRPVAPLFGVQRGPFSGGANVNRPSVGIASLIKEQQRQDSEMRLRMEISRLWANAANEAKRWEAVNSGLLLPGQNIGLLSPLSVSASAAPIYSGSTSALTIEPAVTAPARTSAAGITALEVVGTDGDFDIVADGQGHYYRVRRPKVRQGRP